MSRPAVLVDLGGGWLGARFDFDRDAIDELKCLRCRWDPWQKLWTFPAWKLDAVADVLEDLGFSVRFPESQAQGPGPGDLEAAAEAFLRALPEPLRRPVYRSLAHVLHPDHGGDTASMQAINRAMQEAS